MAYPQFREERVNILQPLSSLSEEILGNVFTFLPLKQAIQYCTVSTAVKRSWKSNRNFIFGRDLFLRYPQNELSTLINNLFDSHTGADIQSFQVHIDPVGVENLIQKWLQICHEKGIEDLELYFYQSGFVLTPEFVNVLEKVRTLKLVHCEIQVPLVISGLRFLKSLVLRHLTISDENIERLIANCTLLSVLELFNCSELGQLNIMARDHKYFKMLKICRCHNLQGLQIDSPTLHSIIYDGRIPKFQFATGIRLIEAYFDIGSDPRNYVKAYLDVEIIVNHFQHVKILTVSALFLEALAARIRSGIFREPEYTLDNVEELQLFMELATFCNPYDIIVFLSKCSSLKRLFIDLSKHPLSKHHMVCDTYWELHQRPLLDKFDGKFNQLRVVKLIDFKFMQSELELVKIILQKAKFLERMIFITPYNGPIQIDPHDAPKYKDLFLSWKTSPFVKLVLYEYSNDDSFVNPSHRQEWCS